MAMVEALGQRDHPYSWIEHSPPLEVRLRMRAAAEMVLEVDLVEPVERGACAL